MRVDEKTIRALTNNEKRRAFLENHEEWDVWQEVPELGMTVRRLDLPDGSIIASTTYVGCEYLMEYGPRKGQMEKPNRFCLIKAGGKYKPNSDSVSWLVEHLKDVRLELVRKAKVAAAE